MNRDRTVVHGNYGIFYNRLPGATITRLQQLGGVVRRSFTMTPSTIGAPTFPKRLTSLSEVSTLTPPNSGFAKPGLATPYVQEVTFGVQQDLGHGMSLDVSYAMGRGLKCGAVSLHSVKRWRAIRLRLHRGQVLCHLT